MYVLTTFEPGCRTCCDEVVKLVAESKDTEGIKSIVVDAGMSCICRVTLRAVRSSHDHWLTRNDSSERTAATGCKSCTEYHLYHRFLAFPCQDSTRPEDGNAKLFRDFDLARITTI